MTACRETGHHLLESFSPAIFQTRNSKRNSQIETSAFVADPTWIGPNAFRALWNASPDAMMLTDAAGTVLAANPSFCALHGFSSRDLVGQSVAVTFPEAEQVSAMEHYRTVFESRDEGYTYPAALRWRGEDGRLLESRIDFIRRDNQTSSMLSSVCVLEEGPAAASRALGGSKVSGRGPEGEKSPSPFRRLADRSLMQTTPEVLADAIQNWGMELVLGTSDDPSPPLDLYQRFRAGQTATGRSDPAVERLDRWEDDGGAPVLDRQPSR